MEQLIDEIEGYAAAVNRSPEVILRAAISASWSQWGKWKAGTSSPTMRVVDRIRAYMAENPAPAEQERGAA
ncbi:hypothetical protein [Oceaniglobus trochenteri]|uniref:hypothetical protein n=1 Tax=Oceaniglobus trochenteri TaxID=2763260 RepID=UPI001CFFD066|nr:hypothetical protein [Oceaniglobus trochenteri]